MYALPKSLRRIGVAALLLALAAGAYAFTNTLSFNGNAAPVSLGFNSTNAYPETVSGVHFDASIPFSDAWDFVQFNLSNVISSQATLSVNLGNAGTYTGNNATSGTAAGTCVPSGGGATAPVTWTCHVNTQNTSSRSPVTAEDVTTFGVQVSQ